MPLPRPFGISIESLNKLDGLGLVTAISLLCAGFYLQYGKKHWDTEKKVAWGMMIAGLGLFLIWAFNQ